MRDGPIASTNIASLPHIPQTQLFRNTADTRDDALLGLHLVFVAYRSFALPNKKREGFVFRKGKAEIILLPNPPRSNGRPQCPTRRAVVALELICFIRLLANKWPEQENTWLVANVYEIAHFGGASGHR